MKKIKTLIIGLLLASIFTLPAWAGSLTTNKFLYKPSLGARGDAEKKTFDAGLDRLDARLGKEIWVGDPNYGTTFQDAIAAIGTTNKTILRIPAGSWPLTSQVIVPANVTLKFEDGAYLDLTGMFDGDIEAWTRAATSQITATGSNIPATGTTYVKPYNLQQCYVSGATHSADWMNYNDNLLTATRVDDNHFTVASTSSFHADYVPASDPGRVCIPVIIKGPIIASKRQIFKVNAAAQVCLASSDAGYISVIDPRSQQEVYPEWFGAVGDGATDDLLALNAARHALCYYDKMVGTLKLSNWYGVSSTFSLNELNYTEHGLGRVEGNGRQTSGFVGLPACAGKPVVEIIGSGYLRLKGFGITGITAAYAPIPDDAPSVALMLGRSEFSANAGASQFEDLGFWGFYQYGAIFNFGYATSQWFRGESQCSTLTGKANNHWMFGVFMGKGDGGAAGLPSWGAALVPTNSTWRTGTNCSADGNTMSDTYMVAVGARMAGSAGIYLRGAYGPNMERLGLGGWGGNDDYYIYAEDSPVDIRDSGGDGHFNLAGVYVCVTSGHNQTIRLQNFSPVVNSGIVLQTDSNTTLADSIVEQIGATAAIHPGISLGRGAINSRFTNLGYLSSFTNASSNITNCIINLPSSCMTATGLNLAGNSGNIIQSAMYNDPVNTLDGDVRIGYPGQTTPSKLIIDPYKLTWAATAPTTGSWPRGSVIWNMAASAGGSPGWICVLDNTFGTLNSGATTGTITSGTKLLTVNSVTGLAVGNFIDVVADGGGNACTANRIVNIDAAAKVVTLVASASASASATGKAVSFHNHTTAEAFSPLPAGARTSGVTAAIATGTTVTHGLGLTPTKVLLTPADAGAGDFYASALGATTFTVNFAGSGTHAFYWEAIQ